MWQQNPDNSEWIKIQDQLSKTNFDFLRQEMEATRLYQVCLSGSSFLTIKGLQNIYDVLGYSQSYNWIVSTQSSEYSSAYYASYSKVISEDTSEEYNKFLKDWGFSLQTKFTPKKILNDDSFNFIEVDIISNGPIENIGSYQPNLIISGVTPKEGETILVKDQLKIVEISNTIDPNNYFTSSWSDFIGVGNYEKTGTNSVLYSIATNENGIYEWKSGKLERTSLLDDYDSYYNLSVSNSAGEQYHLERLKNGYFPDWKKGDAVSFVENTNYLLRNRVDYNNIYEIYYNDIAKWTGETFSYLGTTYSTPTRTISVGEFGVIYLNQSGYSTIVPNKWKETINSISDTSSYYWMAANKGHLLRMSKIDLTINKIDIKEIHDLKSIIFLDDFFGFVVGKFNTIWFTEDGGRRWKKLYEPEFDEYSYTKVIMKNKDTVFIGGESGLFIELNREYNNWIFYKRMIIKDLDTTEPTEDYLMVEDVRDFAIATYSYNNWPLTYSFATDSVISPDKEVLFIVTNGNNIIAKDLNNFESKFEFKYLSFTKENIDISSIAVVSGSSSLYVSADSVYRLDLNTFNLLGSQSNLISSTVSPSITHDYFVNKLYNWDNTELLLCGNNSLLKYTGFTAGIDDIDSTFNNKFKSKMLFLNYDIASKLNFFDDSQEYRVPLSVGLTAGDIGNWLVISNKEGEYNWLSYYKDFEKTFEYYTSFDSANEVRFSTAFTFSANSYFTFSSADVTGATADILPLAPNILSVNSPLIVASSSVIAASPASKSLFFSRHLVIFKKTTAYNVDKGDVMYLTCDVVTSRFVVNKILTFGADKYIYCYHDFEQGVVNDLLNYSGEIHIMNLNKYTAVEVTDSAQIAYDNDPFLYPWNYDNDINPDDYFAYGPFKNPDLYGNLLLHFSLHPVSYGYKLTQVDNSYTIEARVNNKTAYYNMQSKVETENIVDYMNYTDVFLNFGFKPTYNLLDFLNNINPIAFTSSKEFLSMPLLEYIPGDNGGGFTSSVVYFDSNPLSTWPKNKIIFGNDLHFEWSCIWKDTFVDVFMRGNDDSSTRMFVMNKYYDQALDGWVIEFHKELTYTPYSVISNIDIKSRRTLTEISEDLQILNNIHKSSTLRLLDIPGYTGESFTNLANELNFKFNTDSYAKIFLSDVDIKQNITSIVFTDELSELCLNVLNLDKQIFKTIVSTDSYNIDSIDYLKITTSSEHELEEGDTVILKFTGGSQSSEYLNSYYTGFQFVKDVVDEFNFVTDKVFGQPIAGTDSGEVLFLSRDPYFNFTPVDLMEVGTDSVQKKAVAVDPKNVRLVGYTYSLVNIDSNKYRYELVDGLGLTDFYDKYPWVLEGNISDAVIGENANGLVWYRGNWDCGRWFGGTWLSGNWLSGDWYEGNWYAFNVIGNRIDPQVTADSNNTNLTYNSNSKWYSGRWFDGTWHSGIWYGGKLYNVDWINGVWFDGIWNFGNWRNGEFKGGVWIDGNWQSGIFNSSNKPAYWIGGNWKSGDFENGIWYDGVFNSDNGLSRFGTKAFNSRTAIWHGGKFRNSEFHSYLNQDDTGAPIQSEYYKYSQWNAGQFNNGNWYGGVAMAINFSNSNWYGGVVEDIQIIGLNVFTQSNGRWASEVTLNGVYYMNVMDEIWIIDEQIPDFNYFGSKDNPKKYYVLSVEQIGDTTKLLLDKDLHNEVIIVSESLGMSASGATAVSNIDTGLRVTANFRESNWKSGVWTNGIFESGFFEGGIWYGGRFSANWGR